MKEIILIGGGGHCKSVIDVIELEGELKINIKDLYKVNNEWYNNY